MRIDAHVTFHPPRHTPELLWPRLEANRFDGCIATGDGSLLELAPRYPWILGLVLPAETPWDLDRLQRHSLFRAVYLADVKSLDFIRELERRQIAVEINTGPEILSRIADAAPGLRIAARAREDLKTLTPRTFVKLAGASKSLIKQTFDTFGPERILFGSDWPNCLAAGTWKQTLADFTQAIGAQPMPVRSLMLGETAHSFYIASGR